ncbi:S-adenosyl-L-methionine-dependent methyltransferase [Stachybotrys elegans]|uniref:S-adenosyl-L-methionine-dependent methyltransferase n=1 Tax=Stachybotrys elegans TaxID=80388 RepID=A0A8K0WQM3_9HYPO|nr:S-adenosyl-L-methionine-dependent methyltransferase [Stachybotrys elegans]
MTTADYNIHKFDAMSPAVWEEPWIKALTSQITTALQNHVAWIGIETDNTGSDYKLFDYACGNGVASHALASFFPVIHGMDISSGMVSQYNVRAEDSKLSHRMHAVVGNLLDDSDSGAVAAAPTDAALVVMSMALHHVSDPATMIRKLSQRLRPGGVLLIIDFVATSESGCPALEDDSPMSHAIAHRGFTEKAVRDMFSQAGLQSWAWKWMDEQTKLPEAAGGVQQLFLARGVREG